MLSIELPRLLGERHPTAARTRRAIRNKLLARRSLAATDHKAIRQSIEDMLSEEIALRDGSWNNRKDEQTRRQCLAHIAEAVYLASDDEGHHALWLRDKCIELTGITKYTALLPLALKAFGPYVYNGDPESCRISDKKVSRDYKSIIRVLSPDVLPPDLVSKWSQPGCGINVSSRPQKVVCGEHPVPLVAELKMHERAINQSDGTMIYLVHKKGSRSELKGLVADPNIVRRATSYIRQQLAARTKGHMPRAKSTSLTPRHAYHQKKRKRGFLANQADRRTTTNRESDKG